MRIFVITKRTLIIWILILALVITGIILLLSFTPNAAAVSSSAMVEAYEMEVLAGRHKEVPVYSVDRADKKIALTIDAAWEDDKTPFILDTLAQYNVKATFFLCGFWVEKYPDEVKQIAAAGHEIGNHTATHPHKPERMPVVIAMQSNMFMARILADTHHRNAIRSTLCAS